MAAGPTPRQIADARRRIVRTLAAEVAELSNINRWTYIPGGIAKAGDVTITAKLQRASNGEACIFAVAESPKGRLEEPTAAKVVSTLMTPHKVEYRVSLATANGPVTTVYDHVEDALPLMRQYAYDHKAFSFAVERA